MKYILAFYILILPTVVFADTVEGVSTQIDQARLNEVKEWVENAKYSLDANLENIRKSNVKDQEERYEDLIETILRQSGDKPNEFLMRNILHRTKVVYASLKQIPSSPKRDVLARRLLEDGVTWAQKMYEPDLNLVRLNREGKLTEALRGAEFAKIGIAWAEYMLGLYYLAPTNTVKLQLMKDLMGLMYNDINNDDAVKRLLAPISGAVVLKHNEIQNLQLQTTLDILVAARELRSFVEQQVQISKVSLSSSPVTIQSIASTETREVSPVMKESCGTDDNIAFTFAKDEIVYRGKYTARVIGFYEDGRIVTEDLVDKYMATSRSTVLAKTSFRYCFGFSIGEEVIRDNNRAEVVGFIAFGVVVTKDLDDGAIVPNRSIDLARMR